MSVTQQSLHSTILIQSRTVHLKPKATGHASHLNHHNHKIHKYTEQKHEKSKTKCITNRTLATLKK